MSELSSYIEILYMYYNSILFEETNQWKLHNDHLSRPEVKMSKYKKNVRDKKCLKFVIVIKS